MGALYVVLFEIYFSSGLGIPTYEWYMFPGTSQPFILCRGVSAPYWLRNWHEHKKIPVVEYTCRVEPHDNRAR